MLDLYNLQALTEVARLGSFRAAAKSLGFTQPAISYRMRALERSLGVPLAIKVGRSVQLTPAGTKLAQRAEELLASLRALEKEFHSYAGLASETLKIVAVQSATATFVPRAITSLHANRPGVSVVLTQASRADSYRMLRVGKVDLALIWEDAPGDAPQGTHDFDREMLRIPLLVDRRCILLPPRHTMAERQTIRLEDLADEYWIAESGRKCFQSACKAAGFAPKVVATTDDQHAMRKLVAGGVGVAMADSLGITASQTPEVAVRLLEDYPPRHIFGLLWPDMIKVPAMAALIDSLRSTVAEIFPRQLAGQEAAWVRPLKGTPSRWTGAEHAISSPSDEA